MAIIKDFPIDTKNISKISEITIGGQPINITPANTVLASYEVPDYGR